jgi:hypothetical protein
MMKHLPLAQFIVLVLILLSLNAPLIESGASTVAKMFDSKPAPAKAEAARKRKSV